MGGEARPSAVIWEVRGVQKVVSTLKFVSFLVDLFTVLVVHPLLAYREYNY